MAGRTLPMKHIDRKELYTSLEARIQYLHTFLDFSSRDIEALITGGKYIRALIPAVVTIVYRKLLQYDITARAFTTRTTSFEGPLDAIPNEDSPQILHRKMFLRAYLQKLCSDPSTMEFWEYLDKVGMMHVGLGRTHPLHVEYVHIGMTLGMVQDILTEAILSHPKLGMGRKMAIVKALGKVIWIQNDLFAKWYVHDGEEFTSGVDYEPVIEREGWLHGRKVMKLDGDESASESGRSDGTEKAEAAAATGEKPKGDGVCPFASMAKGVEDLKVDEKAAGEGNAPEA